MKKKKGMTLIEIIVAIACSTIVIGTIVSSLLFVTRINDQLLNKSSTLYKVEALKKYIIENYETDMEFTCSDGNVFYNDKKIVENSLINAVKFKGEIGIKNGVECNIVYADVSNYIFTFKYKE